MPYERTSETILKDRKFKNSQRKMLVRKVWARVPFPCSFFSQQGRKNFNLWVLECEITTKSQINLKIELKRQNSQKIEVLHFIRIATPVPGEARQNLFLN